MVADLASSSGVLLWQTRDGSDVVDFLKMKNTC